MFFFVHSVMLVHDKLSLALSVPDISAHGNQYNLEKEDHQQQVIRGQWTSCSVPAQNANGLLVDPHTGIPLSINDDGGQSPGNFPISKNVLVVEPSNTTASTNNTSGLPAIPDSSARSGSSTGANHGWFNGLMGCLRPVWTILGKATAHDLKHHHTQGTLIKPFIE